MVTKYHLRFSHLYFAGRFSLFLAFSFYSWLFCVHSSEKQRVGARISNHGKRGVKKEYIAERPFFKWLCSSLWIQSYCILVRWWADSNSAICTFWPTQNCNFKNSNSRWQNYIMYATCIIGRSLYIFYPIFECHFFLFWRFF